jgi:hypothetical protein
MEVTEKFKINFYDSFGELSILYTEVKGAIFLAEYENKEQKYIISSVNELRNTLDHIMRAFIDPEVFEKNYNQAKSHLLRAGYDAYEIIIISKLNEIKRINEEFSISTISDVYPEYFSRVLPIIVKAKNKLVSSRSSKQSLLDIQFEKEYRVFHEYEEIATNLIQITDELQKYIPTFEEYHSNNYKKSTRSLLINMIIGIISAVISGLAIYLLFK